MWFGLENKLKIEIYVYVCACMCVYVHVCIGLSTCMFQMFLFSYAVEIVIFEKMYVKEIMNCNKRRAHFHFFGILFIIIFKWLTNTTDELQVDENWLIGWLANSLIDWLIEKYVYVTGRKQKDCLILLS